MLRCLLGAGDGEGTRRGCGEAPFPLLPLARAHITQTAATDACIGCGSFRRRQVRILILGLDNAGKTTILYRLHQVRSRVRIRAVFACPCVCVSGRLQSASGLPLGFHALPLLLCSSAHARAHNSTAVTCHFLIRAGTTGRSCDNNPDDRVQRGNSQLQEYTVSSVGLRRAVEHSTVLAVLLSKYQRHHLCRRLGRPRAGGYLQGGTRIDAG